jgi:hypothetical protein
MKDECPHRVKVMLRPTVRLPVCLGIKQPFRAYDQNCITFAGLFIWSALSDERTDLSHTIAAGPRQCCHSRTRVPWGSRPYFRSPPTTRRVTVEVFESASSRDRENALFSARPLIHSSGNHGKCLLLLRINGNFCWMFVYLEAFVLPELVSRNPPPWTHVLYWVVSQKRPTCHNISILLSFCENNSSCTSNSNEAASRNLSFLLCLFMRDGNTQCNMSVL